MFNEHHLIHLKNQDWLDKQRIAGKAVGACLSWFASNVDAGINLLEIEGKCDQILKEYDCTPTFHNYKGFPGKVCLSVNKVMVHGIPHDYVIKDGDLVSLDLGATYQGAIADAATTVMIGNQGDPMMMDMLNTCKNALRNAIANIHIGAPLGRIGNAIFRTVRDTKYGLIQNYGGHGIHWNTPHADPFVSNKADPKEGVLITPGMTLAIEPMLTQTSNTHTSVLTDGWSVVTVGLSCHEEHTIFVGENEIEVITKWS